MLNLNPIKAREKFLLATVSLMHSDLGVSSLDALPVTPQNSALESSSSLSSENALLKPVTCQCHLAACTLAKIKTPGQGVILWVL
ncbi:hypothetical protein VNO77_22765 [Canavalia gladiata]|uniref:Uncharacterized protein n=1 Tax=Canavalia gladiata TaxID=3824 RepID=A0AAN9L456_CANGL